MTQYKVEDFEKLEKNYGFLRAELPQVGNVLYLPMPHTTIVLYTVCSQGLLIFERNVVGPKSSNDFDKLGEYKYEMMEDYMKATRTVAELEVMKIISKVKKDEVIRGSENRK